MAGRAVKKKRVPIPDDTAAEIVWSSDRTCCVCEIAGRPCQLHHIDENPANNSVSNLALLCTLCHNETMVTGGFGRRLNAGAVTRFRDKWLARVNERRRQVDEILLTAKTAQLGLHNNHPETAPKLSDYFVMEKNFMEEFKAIDKAIQGYPDALSRAYEQYSPGFGGSTADMMNASYGVIAVLSGMLQEIAATLPAQLFGELTPKAFIEQMVQQRFSWRRALAEPGGLGTGGTIVGPIAAGEVTHDLEEAVEDAVASLYAMRITSESKATANAWKARWREAREAWRD